MKGISWLAAPCIVAALTGSGCTENQNDCLKNPELECYTDPESCPEVECIMTESSEDAVEPYKGPACGPVWDAWVDGRPRKGVAFTCTFANDGGTQ